MANDLNARLRALVEQALGRLDALPSATADLGHGYTVVVRRSDVLHILLRLRADIADVLLEIANAN